MLKLRTTQIHGMVLPRRDLLIRDVERHLAEFRPDLQAIYPMPYLRWVIADSIDLAAPFKIDDVFSLRLFVRLRWEIAPGFHKQPQIAKVLAQTGRTAQDRFQELTGEGFVQAWEDAEQFDGPREWRTRFWGIGQ